MQVICNTFIKGISCSSAQEPPSSRPRGHPVTSALPGPFPVFPEHAPDSGPQKVPIDTDTRPQSLSDFTVKYMLSV